ncbi:MAG: hypothetical protein LBI56_03945 [Puniceicoccales bacterium]|nr:hypothetical protein [Puniceicoccales bacterium]
MNFAAHEIAYLGNLNSCIGCEFTLTLDGNRPIEKISSPFPRSMLSDRRVNFDRGNPGATSAMAIKIPNPTFTSEDLLLQSPLKNAPDKSAIHL